MIPRHLVTLYGPRAQAATVAVFCALGLSAVAFLFCLAMGRVLR